MRLRVKLSTVDLFKSKSLGSRLSKTIRIQTLLDMNLKISSFATFKILPLICGLQMSVRVYASFSCVCAWL